MFYMIYQCIASKERLRIRHQYFSQLVTLAFEYITHRDILISRTRVVQIKEIRKPIHNIIFTRVNYVVKYLSSYVKIILSI